MESLNVDPKGEPQGSVVHMISCNSEWLIDEKAKRFLRMPRGSRIPDLRSVPAHLWAGYANFVVDTARSELIIYINEGRSRIIRAYLHIDGCAKCQSDDDEPMTTELSQITDIF